jgi:hypothetical protein
MPLLEPISFLSLTWEAIYVFAKLFILILFTLEISMKVKIFKEFFGE